MSLFALLLSGCHKQEPSSLENLPKTAISSGIQEETFREEINIRPILEQKAEPLKSETLSPQSPSEVFEETLVPRTIIALWDSKAEDDIFFTFAHTVVEMPLNFYGYKLEFVDMQKELPNLKEREDIHGILTWFPLDYVIEDLGAFVDWSVEQINQGKVYVLFGSYNKDYKPEVQGVMKKLLIHLGIYSTSESTYLTYPFAVQYARPELFNFEKIMVPPLPPFEHLKVVSPSTEVLAYVSPKDNYEEKWPVVLLADKGAFIQPEYALYARFNGTRYEEKWYLNPFIFFREAFQLKNFPIPDPSTVSGRRAYYSHIDGDGWNNVTYAVKQKSSDLILSSEIIGEKVIEYCAHLPVTVGPIAANLNIDWNGTQKSQTIARGLFKLDNVEIGCHTYSHPFEWGFFEHYTQDKERPYLSKFPGRTWANTRRNLLTDPSNESFYQVEDETRSDEELEKLTHAEQLKQAYVVPRAYATKPFDLNLEITGALQEIARFAPDGKKVKVYQWSGNAMPWKEAIRLTVEDKVSNINGGDSRYDFQFPSYAYVSPLTRTLGDEIQVYTSSSNENLYTELWTTNFYGFVTLPTTWNRTESPLRLKALNLYYHMYSGERLSSLNALLKNIAYVDKHPVTPIDTSSYCKSVDGFMSAQIISEGNQKWKILSRGGLNCLRVDNATFTGVDFSNSKGIIGQRHLHGSLYIYLDEKEEVPEIAMIDIEESYREPDADVPYLIESRWEISYLRTEPLEFSFLTHGFGRGEMRWKMPEDGIYEITLFNLQGDPIERHEEKSVNTILQWTFEMSGIEERKVIIKEVGL